MAKHLRGMAQMMGHGRSLPPASAIEELVSLWSTGQWDKLIAKAKRMTLRFPQHDLGWKALGKSYLTLGKGIEAVAALRRASVITPANLDTLNDLGLAQNQAGLIQEAEDTYRRALKVDPNFFDALLNLGNLLTNSGRFAEATERLQRCLELAPEHPNVHNSFGNLLLALGRPQEAEGSYLKALRFRRDYLDAWVNLGSVFRAQEKWGEAEAAFRQALSLAPNSEAALFCLCSLLGRLTTQDQELLQLLQRLLALNPRHADGYLELGNANIRLGQREAAWQAFDRAQQLRTLVCWPANPTTKQEFSVLALDNPGAGSTPVNYLLGNAPFDCYFYCVVPGRELAHIPQLKEKAGVIFNVLGDADNGQDILPSAAAVADAIGRPIVNHPRAVMQSGREELAQRLAGIPHCLVPKTVRIPPEPTTQDRLGAVAGLAYPMLARVAGTHGGDLFEKCEGSETLAAFLAKKNDATCYVSEYIDYRSTDNYFRKYRWICIDGELFPYHLAIHTDWKVHYFRTDMGNQSWMRMEEEAFLRDPHEVFNAHLYQALRTIAAATKLEYCGIDCGLTSAGDIVLFEANATMLVHDEKDPTFVYKNPYIAQIKDALGRLLARLASMPRH